MWVFSYTYISDWLRDLLDLPWQFGSTCRFNLRIEAEVLWDRDFLVLGTRHHIFLSLAGLDGNGPQFRFLQNVSILTHVQIVIGSGFQWLVALSRLNIRVRCQLLSRRSNILVLLTCLGLALFPYLLHLVLESEILLPGLKYLLFQLFVFPQDLLKTDAGILYL